MIRIYLIGSLRNRERVQDLAERLREDGHEVFDDWLAPGPEADDNWKEYSEARGDTYEEALQGYAAKHIYDFDKFYIDRADVGVLVMPAGKSGFLELGYMIGRGKRCYILMDNPDRWDVMMLFADKVVFRVDDLLQCIPLGKKT